MTLLKHILLRVAIFGIVTLFLTLGFYIKFLITNDGIEILQFAFFGFIWLFISATYLLFESSELREKSKRKLNLLTGYLIFTILIIAILQFAIGATSAF